MRTAARDHLDSLLRQHPLPDRLSAMSELDLSSLGLPTPLTTEQLKLAQSDRVLSLLLELKGVLPSSLLPLFEQNQLVVGELGADAPNAQMIMLGAGQFVVVMHSGLFSFLYRIARPLASSIFRGPGETSNSSGIERPQLARTIAEIFWWLEKTGSSMGPDYAITVEQKLLANKLAMRAERFLLAHEIGHILYALREQSVDCSVEQISEAEEEHLADLCGLNLTLEACLQDERTDPTELMLTYAGAELALQIWGVMSSIGLPFVDDIHPPAATRIEAMRGLLREACPTDDAFDRVAMAAKVIQQAFDEVGRIILSPGEHIAVFEAEAEAVVASFLGLLDECSTDIPPNYAAFYSQAPALLSRGYPEQVLEMVFQRVASRFKELMTASQDQTEHVGALRRFGQYKLLLGLTDNIRGPAKSIYDAALGM